MNLQTIACNQFGQIRVQTIFAPHFLARFTSFSKTKNLLLATFVLASFVGFSQTTPILDNNFEQALIDLGIDANGKNNTILNSDAVAVTHLDVSNKEIESLTGIEAFTSLTYLNCGTSTLGTLTLSTLDVSSNTVLTDLVCSGNSLTALNVSKNTALTRLWCFNNQLTSLNLKNGNNRSMRSMASFLATNNPRLRCIEVDDPVWSEANQNWRGGAPYAIFREYCATTPIPDANFEKALIRLGIDTNGKRSIITGDILNSDATAVTSLNVSRKSIRSLSGIEAFTNLISLNSNFNNLDGLDVSNNDKLTSLRCKDNELTSLNVRNGNNSMLTTFNATNNPNLRCIQADNVAYSTANWTNKDATAVYNEDCTTLSNEDFKKTGFHISPNPTSGILNITATEKAD